jgi:hypothetical protein
MESEITYALMVNGPSRHDWKRNGSYVQTRHY